MLVLLPPSEGKTPGGDGPPLGPRPTMSTPALAAPRAALVAAVRHAAAADPAALAAGLRLPPGLADAALAADRAVTRAATRPALDRYAGVVYAALDAGSLSAAARRRADEQVLVLSGLWGVVRGGDPVPDYRVPASGSVPGLGRVVAHWRQPLAAALPALVGDSVVLDLRSTDYTAMWRPTGAVRARVIAVRVLAERGSGNARKVGPVSYHAKWVKGRLARHLVSSRRRPRTVLDLAAAVAAAAADLDLRVVDGGTLAAPAFDLVGRYP